MKVIWVLHMIYLTVGGDFGIVMSQIPGTTYAEQYPTEAACQADLVKYTARERTPKNVLRVKAFCTQMETLEAASPGTL